MKSIFDQAGYYSNDNRASGGTYEEDDLLGCKHCQALLRKSEWKKKGGFCNVCFSPLCLTCAERAVQFGCVPYERFVEQEIKQVLRRLQI